MDSKRIIELAEQTELHCEMDIEMSRCLPRFVELVECEVRGGANTHHPPSVSELNTHQPDLVAQLVGALRTLFDACLIVQSPDGVFYTKHPDKEPMEKAKAALAAAKEAGL